MTSPLHSLAGRRILVTGASSGIGKAAAALCAEHGAQLVCLGRDQQRLAQTVASLAGEGHAAVAADLGDTDAIIDLVKTAAQQYGPLSAIVHAAGIQKATPLRVARAEDFVSHFRTNTLSAALLLAAAARRGVAAPAGCSIVLVGSVMSTHGAAGLSAYCMSKAALLGLMRAAALELAPQNIRVNAVLPGVVDTPMSQQYRAAMSAEQVQAVAAMHPLGTGQPADVAESILYLVSDASRWVTGTCLTVDGGYSAH